MEELVEKLIAEGFLPNEEVEGRECELIEWLVKEKNLLAIPCSEGVLFLGHNSGAIRNYASKLRSGSSICCLSTHTAAKQINQLFNENYKIDADNVVYLLKVICEDDLVPIPGGRYMLRSNTIYSELTQTYYWSDDPELIEIKCGDKVFAALESDVDNIAFYCELTRRWYAHKYHKGVCVEGKWYLRSLVENNIYSSRGGKYRWKYEPYLGLAAYHKGNRRPWQPGKRLSFELEVCAGFFDPNFGNAVREVWDEAEKDKSLDSMGAELIVGFVPLEEVRTKIEAICQLAKRFECKVPDDYYGFHVSASISGWGLTLLQVRRLAKAFYKNYDLVVQVAGRLPNHYCQWQNPNNFILNREKYLALRKKKDRLEFRIFKASIDPEKLMRCVQLVYAFLEFAISEEKNFCWALPVLANRREARAVPVGSARGSLRQSTQTVS